MLFHIDPDVEGIHPLRHHYTEEEMCALLSAVLTDNQYLSNDQLDAARDYVYDAIAAKNQTHLGSAVLQ